LQLGGGDIGVCPFEIAVVVIGPIGFVVGVENDKMYTVKIK